MKKRQKKKHKQTKSSPDWKGWEVVYAEPHPLGVIKMTPSAEKSHKKKEEGERTNFA